MLNHSKPNTKKPRIAIEGATGRVGATLTALLAADPIDLVALTRESSTARLPEGLAAFKVDFKRADTLEEALRGIDRLFITHGTSLEQVPNEIALINAAVASGVRHIVKLSALGPATRLFPLAWHMQIEAHLAQQPIASTVLRPTSFSLVLKRLGPQIAAGSWAGSAGNGRVNFIDIRDVAEVARIALLEKIEPTSQRAYHLSVGSTCVDHEPSGRGVGPPAWASGDLRRPFTCRAARGSARRRTFSAGSRCLGWTGPNVPRVCDSRNDVNRRGTDRKGPTFVDRVVDRQPGRVPGVSSP